MLGGGPAGLATSQQLSQHRVPHRVLERGDDVGHTWANLYDSLTLHTGKHMSGLPGMPLPRSAPLFVPREEFLHYLQRYARAFDLPVDTGRHVERMTRTDGTWTVNTSRGVLAARAVVVATGIVANPKTPHFPGQDRFAGRIAHSVAYRRPDGYAGRRMLVVGVGNSGAEIASELARAGAKVTVAVRSGANVVPLTLAGLPIQYVAYWVRKLPRPVMMVEFEGLVASVDIAGSTFTVGSGAVVTVTGETRIDAEGGGLLTLQAVSDALAAQHMVRAEGHATVTSAGPPLALTALDVKFETP